MDHCERNFQKGHTCRSKILEKLNLDRRTAIRTMCLVNGAYHGIPMFVQQLPRCELPTPENQFLHANIHRPDPPPSNLCPSCLSPFHDPYIYIYIL